MSANTTFRSNDSPLQLRTIDNVSRRPVRRDEYCSLLISRRRLERCDDQVRLHRGLLDLTSHELFEISDYDLFVAR